MDQFCTLPAPEPGVLYLCLGSSYWYHEKGKQVEDAKDREIDGKHNLISWLQAEWLMTGVRSQGSVSESTEKQPFCCELQKKKKWTIAFGETENTWKVMQGYWGPIYTWS